MLCTAAADPGMPDDEPMDDIRLGTGDSDRLLSGHAR